MILIDIRCLLAVAGEKITGSIFTGVEIFTVLCERPKRCLAGSRRTPTLLRSVGPQHEDLVEFTLEGVGIEALESDGHVRILRNQLETGNNWVGVRLQGARGAAPFGAKVTLRHADTAQVLPLITGDSWKAQHPAILHFGLGKTKSIEAIEVRWPNGKTTRLKAPEINRYHIIKASQ